MPRLRHTQPRTSPAQAATQATACRVGCMRHAKRAASRAFGIPDPVRRRPRGDRGDSVPGRPHASYESAASCAQAYRRDRHTSLRPHPPAVDADPWRRRCLGGGRHAEGAVSRPSGIPTPTATHRATRGVMPNAQHPAPLAYPNGGTPLVRAGDPKQRRCAPRAPTSCRRRSIPPPWHVRPPHHPRHDPTRHAKRAAFCPSGIPEPDPHPRYQETP